MEPAQFILPVIATSALAAAVFVPLRDDRRGRRATLSQASSPLRLDFASVRIRGTTSAVTVSQGDEEHRGAIADAVPASACIDRLQEPMRVEVHAAKDDETTSSGPPSADAAKQRSPDRVINRGALTTRDEGVPEFWSREVPVAALPAVCARAVRLDALRAFFEACRKLWPPMHETVKLPMSQSQPPTHPGDVESRGDSATHDVVVERSFAVEVADLLSPPQDDDSWKECASARDDRTATVDCEPVDRSTTDRPVQPMVVRPRRAPVERIVPLTRLPLRTQSSDITWFASLSVAALPQSAQERHALLEEPSTARDFDLLVQAYRQEDARGRILALRALSTYHAREAREIFTEALRAGTDDERVIALDALAASDARDALPTAFDDRVDAIAARAALAFVATNRRSDYIAALEPYVDPAHIEAILALLAGFVE